MSLIVAALGVLSFGLGFWLCKNLGLMSVVWRQISHTPFRSSVVVLCIAISIAIPTLTTILVDHYDSDLKARARTTPLILGSKGNQIDLTLASLYFRSADFDTVPFSLFERISGWNKGVAIPMNLRFQAQGHPICATSPEYFEKRKLTCDQGRFPFRLGEVVLGADMAAGLDLKPGDFLFSDQKELYDISKPAALKMHVVGTLLPSNSPDDQAAFVATGTAWILEGLSHGHKPPQEISEDLLLAKKGDNITVSGAMIEYNEVTKENASGFHYHGDSNLLPLSSILFFPHDTKAGVISAARIKSGKLYQMVKPIAVVDELMAKVFQVKAFLDLVSVLLAISTSFLIGLVCVLTARMRQRETDTLKQIGIAKGRIAALLLTEIGTLLISGIALAGLLVAGSWFLLPNLIQTL